MWNEDLRQDRYREAFEESLEKLQMDYVDMYMIHWPVPKSTSRRGRKMERSHAEEKARCPGCQRI